MVHGTFSAPADGPQGPDEEPLWYEPDGHFSRALTDALRGTELEGAVWREWCDGDEPPACHALHWFGGNSHREQVAIHLGRIGFDDDTPRLTAPEPAQDTGVPTTHVAFSTDEDARWVATADRAGRVRLFDAHAETLGATATVLGAHGGRLAALTFADDGRLLVTAGTDGTVRWWDLRTCSDDRASPGACPLLQDACRAISAEMSPAEWASSVPMFAHRTLCPEEPVAQ